jgi:lipopolysaccharide transport system ATP-binding protein
MAPIIEARGLGKRYRLGVTGHETETFRELLLRLVRAPWRPGRARRGRALGPEHLWALRDLDFDVAEGEVVGIIGRNGAGKSTLLKVLSRITEPTRGVVTVRGRLASLLEVGTGFHPELTGRENIFLNGAILGMRRAEIRGKLEEIVEFAEVGHFLETPVKRWSSGMYVRLAFAVAAHLEPEILVVDEVLAVGDAAFQKKCLGKMSEVSRGGRTILFVSHNMAAVESLCSRGMVLTAGRKVFDGAVEEAIGHYLASLAELGSEAPGHVIDLENAPGRDAASRPVFKRVELLTTDDRPVVVGVPVGAPLKVRFHLEVERALGHFDVIAWFQTLFGQTVLTASTMYAAEAPSLARPGAHPVVLELPRLTLLPGEYTLKLAFQVGSVPLDSVADAVRFTVLPADFYGTGKLPTSGAFVLEQRWTLE